MNTPMEVTMINDHLEFTFTGVSKEKACKETCKLLIDYLNAGSYVEFVKLDDFIPAPVQGPSWKTEAKFQRTDEEREAVQKFNVEQRTIDRTIDISAVDENGDMLKDEEKYEQQKENGNITWRVSIYGRPLVPEKN